MGAEFCTMFSKSPDKIKVREEFADRVQEDAAEHGHRQGYCGSFGQAGGRGLVFRDEAFEEKADAWDWLDENCEKWGPALAVRVRNEGWAIGFLAAS